MATCGCAGRGTGVVLDYILTGLVFTAIGLVSEEFVGKGSRPGDPSLKRLPARVTDGFWSIQRAIRWGAIAAGQVYLLWGVWLWVGGR